VKEFATPLEERQRLSRVKRARYWNDDEHRLRSINRCRIWHGLEPRASLDEVQAKARRA
jgi:hypothetical protein